MNGLAPLAAVLRLACVRQRLGSDTTSKRGKNARRRCNTITQPPPQKIIATGRRPRSSKKTMMSASRLRSNVLSWTSRLSSSWFYDTVSHPGCDSPEPAEMLLPPSDWLRYHLSTPPLSHWQTRISRFILTGYFRRMKRAGHPASGPGCSASALGSCFPSTVGVARQTNSSQTTDSCSSSKFY